MNTEKVLDLFTDYFVDSFKSIAPELSNSSLNTINEILVAEMMARYDKLISKRTQYPEQFTKQDIKELVVIKDFLTEEKVRKLGPSSLEEKVYKFLNDNLPK